MSHHLTVKVLDKDSKILKGAPVKISIKGPFGATELPETHTDSTGVAVFTTQNDYGPGQPILISVRGRTVGTFSIDRGSYTVKAH